MAIEQINTGGINQRLADLSPAKRALLEAKLAQKKPDEALTIPPRPHAGPAPLSFAQERLWFIEQLTPGTVIYNRPSCIRLTGLLDPSALERAWNDLLQRQEVLRTAYPLLANGEPRQIATPVEWAALPVVDLDAANEHCERCHRLVAELIDQPFDLQRGPLWRGQLLTLGETEHILALVIHHSIFDGWSMGILLRELAALYQAHCTGQPAKLPVLPVHYIDFSYWKRDRLRGEHLERLLDYWQQQLAGELPSPELPADYPHRTERTFNGASRSRLLPKSFANELKACSTHEGVTLFMMLLAAYAVLLTRYSRCEEVVVGTPIAVRSHLALEELIGNFVNTLVLRVNLTGNPTFRELLSRVRETALAAYAHSEVPFEKLVEAVQPQRRQNQNPLFLTLFQLRNMPGDPVEAAGVRFEEFDAETSVARTDLSMDIVEQDDGLLFYLEYNTDLFTAATIDHILEQLELLLQGALAHPELPCSRLPLVTPAEQRLLEEWNATERPRIDLCLHQLLAQKAIEMPDVVAVRSEKEALTYRELDQRANQLARVLIDMGVRPNTPVGMSLERSLNLTVALLGILKAGGAYVPLDPTYPRERLTFMLEDTRAPIIVTTSKLVDGLPVGNAHVLCLDTDRERIARESTDDPRVAMSPDNLVLIIYTSGSTGTPKGVRISHRAVVNHNLAAVNLYQIRPGDRMLQFSSINFDMAVEEIFPTWLAGATLVFRPVELLSGSEFVRWLEVEGITILDLSTAFWHEWVKTLSAGGVAPPGTLRLVILGGEAASSAAYAVWHGLTGGTIRLVNTYGPTEATVIATAYDPATDPSFRPGDELLIGRPIDNTQVYVLDPEGEPAPIGVPGELYIGGLGVASGYLNQPALTAERFVADSFSGRPGARLYRTGDLARWRADGQLQFLGRVDDQVKIRGFRVEPGEIVTLLNQHPAVHESVVVPRGQPELRLVAYVVPRDGQTLNEAELKRYVKEHLPGYMRPAAYVILPELPLTTNGKVDRRALPEPKDNLAGDGRIYVPPRDKLDEELIQIWHAVLGKEHIGINDDFFALGGHSLLAVRLFTIIEKVLGAGLPLASLFQAPTVAGLADLIRQEGWTLRWSSLIPLQPAGIRPPFLYVASAGGSALAYEKLARLLGKDRPFYVLQEAWLEGEEEPEDRIEALATHYLREIRELQPEGPYYLGGHCFGGLVALEMAQQLRRQGQEVALLAMCETYSPRKPDRYNLKFRLNRLATRAQDAGFRIQVHMALQGLRHWGKEQVRGVKFKLLYGLHLRTPELLRRVDPIAFYRMVTRRYQAQYYPGKIVLLRSQGHPYFNRDPLLWWDGLADEVELRETAGEHGTFLHEPHIQVLAQQLAETLQAAQEAYGIDSR